MFLLNKFSLYGGLGKRELDVLLRKSPIKSDCSSGQAAQTRGNVSISRQILRTNSGVVNPKLCIVK